MIRVLLFFLLALPAFAAPAIQSVEIRVNPPRGGFAFCRYDQHGKMHGGHVSPPPAVVVHEADGQAEEAVAREIWKLAEDLVKRKVVKGPIKESPSGKTYLTIKVQDQELLVSWPFKGQHADAGVRKLADLLHKHHVGGW